MATALAHLRRSPLPARATVAAWTQVGAGVLAWALFVAGWVRVLASGLAPARLLRDVALLAAILVVVASVTAWWIRHNRAIYQRKGPRRAAPAGPGYPARDRLGRAVDADVAAVTRAGDILVIVDGETKRFEPC